MYPEDCVQSIIHPDAWWTNNTDKVLCRGALVFAFVPHVDIAQHIVGDVPDEVADI